MAIDAGDRLTVSAQEQNSKCSEPDKRKQKERINDRPDYRDSGLVIEQNETQQDRSQGDEPEKKNPQGCGPKNRCHL